MAALELLYYPQFCPKYEWLLSNLLFYDRVLSIIPENLGYQLPSEITEINRNISNAFCPIDPESNDIRISDVNLKLLEGFFEKIHLNQSIRYPNNQLIINKNGTFRLNGYSLLADAKISYDVRDLLIRHSLIVEETSGENISVVNREAANLIVSLVADNIASSKRINTITDHEKEFSLNTLNSLNVSRIKHPDNFLVSSMISSQIPAKISSLSIEQYCQIRDEYKEIRKLFRKYSIEKRNDRELDAIGDPKELECAINDIVVEFDEELSRIKGTIEVAKWVNISFGMIQLLGITFQQPIIQIIGGTKFIIDCITPQKFDDFDKKFLRLFSQLKSDIEYGIFLREYLKNL